MSIARIDFHQCVQDSQDYGSDDEHMVSRVFFSLQLDGVSHENLHVDIKQPVGDKFEAGPLEVGAPQGYRGPINHAEFRAAVEKYYRRLVGSAGSGIRIVGGGNIRMRNNRFVMPWGAEVSIDPSKGGW